MRSRVQVLTLVVLVAMLGVACDRIAQEAVVRGPACPTCCSSGGGWVKVQLPSGGYRFTKTTGTCGRIKFSCDSASTDPGNTCIHYSTEGDSASTDTVGVTVDSVVIYGH